MTLGAVLDGHRLIVCVGTGGVGKTTLAAALALAGALRGRRAMVLTIDPARQLARALGLAGLRHGGEPVPAAALAVAGLAVSGALHAGMLDQKGAWDAFIARHAPEPAIRDAILGNPFYERLSASFAGSTEYMAVEELCRLDESGAHDLIVLDTPPAGHALDFLRAPERLTRLLDPEVAGWLTRPSRSLGRAAGAGVRLVVSLLKRAVGSRTLRDVAAFFVALDALLGDIERRTTRARALLGAPTTAFVLVAGPDESQLAGGATLAATMAELGAPLRAAIINRVQPAPAGAAAGEVEGALAELAAAGVDGPVLAWLRDAHAAAGARARVELARLAGLAAALPSATAWAEIPELDHDVHSLHDLGELVERLGLGDGPQAARTA